MNTGRGLTGVIIEESLIDASVLSEVKVVSTNVEEVTESHKTPWVSQWTMHTIQVPSDKAEIVAGKISEALDSSHGSWYADFKNNTKHFIVFSGKVFCVNQSDRAQYEEARRFGIALGIPEYQLDFDPNVKRWERE